MGRVSVERHSPFFFGFHLAVSHNYEKNCSKWLLYSICPSISNELYRFQPGICSPAFATENGTVHDLNSSADRRSKLAHCIEALTSPFSAFAKFLNPLKVMDRMEKSFKVNAQEFMPKDFYKSVNGEVVVGVNGAVGTESSDLGKIVAGFHYTSKTVFQIDPFSGDEFLDLLVQIRESAGPIQRLLIVSHGAPGTFRIHKTVVGNSWVQKNKNKLMNLPRDLFAPNATVVLIGCHAASGYFFNSEYGTQSLRNIFSHLIKQGGNIIASNRITIIKHENYSVTVEESRFDKMASALEAIGERLLQPLEIMAYALMKLIVDPFFRSEKFSVIHLEPSED